MVSLVWNTSDVLRLFRAIRQDGDLLLGLWFMRRWKLARALGKLAWDVEAVELLAGALGHPVSLEEREVVRDGCDVMARLDEIFGSEVVGAVKLLRSPRMAVSLGMVWLSLELQLQPDEQSLLTGLRSRLATAADRREIDLRGLGV